MAPRVKGSDQAGSTQRACERHILCCFLGYPILPRFGKGIAMRLVGILLVILGVVALIYQGLTFVIPKDYVDLGFMSITVYREMKIPLPPILGAVALIAGVALILSSPGPAQPADRPPPQ
jgi:hypothetical protein